MRIVPFQGAPRPMNLGRNLACFDGRLAAKIGGFETRRTSLDSARNRGLKAVEKSRAKAGSRKRRFGGDPVGVGEKIQGSKSGPASPSRSRKVRIAASRARGCWVGRTCTSVRIVTRGSSRFRVRKAGSLVSRGTLKWSIAGRFRNRAAPGTYQRGYWMGWSGACWMRRPMASKPLLTSDWACSRDCRADVRYWSYCCWAEVLYCWYRCWRESLTCWPS